jgi:hypothetical protein
MIPESEDTFSMRSSHEVLDQVDALFDDERAVASAGLLLSATLAERLGIEPAADQLLDLGTGRAQPAQGASCSRWSIRWLPVGTASTTSNCCAVGPPRRCLAIG